MSAEEDEIDLDAGVEIEDAEGDAEGEDEGEEGDLAIPSTETIDSVDLRRIPDNERRSLPVLGYLAKASLVAKRARQLEEGQRSVIPLVRLVSRDPIQIAKQELREKVIPFKIIRRFPDGTYEEWGIKDFRFITRGND